MWRTNLREKWVETKKQFTEIISGPGGSLLVLEHVTWSGRQPPNVALGPRVAGSQLDQGPSQYPKRRLSVRSRKVSKPRDLYLELSDRSEIWPALRQQCCRCACQISKRYDNLKYQSRGCETLRDLTNSRLFGYWDGARGDHWSVYPSHSSKWSGRFGKSKFSDGFVEDLLFRDSPSFCGHNIQGLTASDLW